MYVSASIEPNLVISFLRALSLFSDDKRLGLKFNALLKTLADSGKAPYCLVCCNSFTSNLYCVLVINSGLSSGREALNFSSATFTLRSVVSFLTF